MEFVKVLGKVVRSDDFSNGGNELLPEQALDIINVLAEREFNRVEMAAQKRNLSFQSGEDTIQKSRGRESFLDGLKVFFDRSLLLSEEDVHVLHGHIFYQE